MKISSIFNILILFLYTSLAQAETSSLGDIANNMMVPVTIAGDFICTGSLVTGTTLIFASFFRYIQYRDNPLASPISTVVMLFILGIMLLCLPFLSLLTGEGIPYSFAK